MLFLVALQAVLFNGASCNPAQRAFNSNRQKWQKNMQLLKAIKKDNDLIKEQMRGSLSKEQPNTAYTKDDGPKCFLSFLWNNRFVDFLVSGVRKVVEVIKYVVAKAMQLVRFLIASFKKIVVIIKEAIKVTYATEHNFNLQTFMQACVNGAIFLFKEILIGNSLAFRF